MILQVVSPKYGKFEVLIDDEDFEKVDRHKWFPDFNKSTSTFYIKSTDKIDGSAIRLHRYIMECPRDMVIDHINHNTLDNRKCNLRICSVGENNRNTLKHGKSMTSKYKGVVYRENRNIYESKIRIKNKDIFIGSFFNEAEAAHAYNVKALELFGEYACVNIIDEEFNKDCLNKPKYVQKSKKKRKDSTSSYVGVSFHKASGKFRAYIQKDNKTYCLGNYILERDAAIAYNDKALEFFGEFAHLNIIPENKEENYVVEIGD